MDGWMDGLLQISFTVQQCNVIHYMLLRYEKIIGIHCTEKTQWTVLGYFSLAEKKRSDLFFLGDDARLR